jgi:hypothetical protein
MIQPNRWGPLLLVVATLIGTSTHANPPTSSIFISFSSDQPEYQQGDSALLSWATAHAKFCHASGDWSGKFPPQGTYRTEPLDAPKSFTLKCVPASNNNRPNVQTVNVMVLPAPDSTPTDPPAPTLSFSAADSSVASAGDTTLNWTATDADSCSASGGWDRQRERGPHVR